MATKIPPQNLEAEESVLGALLISKDAMHRVADTLRTEDFYKPTHGVIYKSIMRLHEKNEPIDVLTLTNDLTEQNKLKEIGGSSYLTRLIESVPSSQHIEHYAKIVKEKKILRDLINASAEISENAFDDSNDIDQVLDNIEQKIFSISQRSVAQRFTSIKEELKTAYERIEKLHNGEGKTRGVPSGFDGIDNLLSGFQRSDLILIGARPSLGKTSLALNMLHHAAVKENIPVGFFSIEMSREQVIDRLIAAEAGVPLWKLRTGRLKDEQDFQRIQQSLDVLSKAPIFIDDTPSPNILQMRSMARRLQAEHGLGIIAVDYLQLIQPRTGSDNIVAQVTEISRGLKAIARELNIPIVALSQLSRSSDQREVKTPRLSDLRDSGSLEQDADVVMFIYRKDRERANLDPEDENTAEIIIAKHRNGPLGTVKLKWDPETTTFMNIDTRHESLEL